MKNLDTIPTPAQKPLFPLTFHLALKNYSILLIVNLTQFLLISNNIQSSLSFLVLRCVNIFIEILLTHKLVFNGF